MPSEGLPGAPPWSGARALILGCGNILLGDDGFGSEVARHIGEELHPPEGVAVVDAGTGVRKVLFDLLLEEGPARIVVVDAVDFGRTPGEIFEIPLGELGPLRSDDFSFHLGPLSNLLFELRERRGMEVRILACQVQSTTDWIGEEMSPPVRAAVPAAAERALSLAS